MNTHRLALAMLAIVAALACGTAQPETLLVVRKSADALDFVDPGSGLRLASVTLGFAPHEVAVSPDGKRAVVSNYGSRERPGSSLSIVDLEQPRELRRLELAPHTRPHGVAWYAPDRIAVTTEGSKHLLIVDPHLGRVIAARPTQQDISHMVAVSASPARAWVANIGSGSISRFDLGDDEPARTLRTGGGTEGIALTPDGQQVWVTARQEGAVVVLDAATLEQTARLPLPGIPIRVAFSPDGATAYVTCAGTAELVAFDTRTRLERGRRSIDVPLAPGAGARPLAGLAAGSPLPIGLVVGRDGASVYVAATMADRVVQLDASSLEVQRTIAVGGEPDGLGVTPVMPRPDCHACGPDKAGRVLQRNGVDFK